MATRDNAYQLREMTRDLLLAGRLWRKIARHAAARHGMSEAASSPLTWIERLGDNVRQNVLAEACGIEGASLVRLIDELEGLSLVRREADPTDRRANIVSLTAYGIEVVHAVAEDLRGIRADVFKGMDDRDIEGAMKVFGAIKAAAAEQDAAIPS
jgi:MarR family transcriptional regulator for hemolysin